MAWRFHSWGTLRPGRECTCVVGRPLMHRAPPGPRARFHANKSVSLRRAGRPARSTHGREEEVRGKLGGSGAVGAVPDSRTGAAGRRVRPGGALPGHARDERGAGPGTQTRRGGRGAAEGLAGGTPLLDFAWVFRLG